MVLNHPCVTCVVCLCTRCIGGGVRKPLLPQLDYTQVAPSTIKRLAKYIQHDALDPAIVGKTSLAALQCVTNRHLETMHD